MGEALALSSRAAVMTNVGVANVRAGTRVSSARRLITPCTWNQLSPLHRLMGPQTIRHIDLLVNTAVRDAWREYRAALHSWGDEAAFDVDTGNRGANEAGLGEWARPSKMHFTMTLRTLTRIK